MLKLIKQESALQQLFQQIILYTSHREWVRRSETRVEIHVLEDAFIVGAHWVSLLVSASHWLFSFASPRGRPAEGADFGVMLRLGALGRVGEKLAVILVDFLPVLFPALPAAVINQSTFATRFENGRVFRLLPIMHYAIGAKLGIGFN